MKTDDRRRTTGEKTTPAASGTPFVKGEIDAGQLRVIALYELYEDLERHHGEPLTGRYIMSLDEAGQELIEHYLRAKLEVLGPNSGLIRPLNIKKADANEGSNPDSTGS